MKSPPPLPVAPRPHLRPLGDRILVEREQAESKIGSLHVPDSVKKKAQYGKVLAVGKGTLTPDGELLPVDVKIGEKVCFGTYAGEDTPSAFGEGIVMLREDEILAVLEP